MTFIFRFGHFIGVGSGFKAKEIYSLLFFIALRGVEKLVGRGQSQPTYGVTNQKESEGAVV